MKQSTKKIVAKAVVASIGTAVGTITSGHWWGGALGFVGGLVAGHYAAKGIRSDEEISTELDRQASDTEMQDMLIPERPVLDSDLNPVESKVTPWPKDCDPSSFLKVYKSNSKPGEHICPHCGGYIETDAKFCNSCGKLLSLAA